MDNDNKEIIDIFLRHTPLYNDIMSIVIDYITHKTFKVGETYLMYIEELDTYFYHEVLNRTKCFVDIDVFDMKYRKKVRYDENNNEYIKLYTKNLESKNIMK